MQTTLDFGKALRDRGMKQVLENSGSWSETAQAVFAIIRPKVAGTEMTGEDIRRLMCDAGMHQPHSPNAWGAFINLLVRRKLIEPTNTYRQMSTPTSHARKTAVYKVAHNYWNI